MKPNARVDVAHPFGMTLVPALSMALQRDMIVLIIRVVQGSTARSIANGIIHVRSHLLEQSEAARRFGNIYIRFIEKQRREQSENASSQVKQNRSSVLQK